MPKQPLLSARAIRRCRQYAIKNAFNHRISKKRRDEATKTLQTVRRLLFSGESIDDDQQLAVFDTFVVYKAAKDAHNRVDMDIAANERAIVANEVLLEQEDSL